MLCVETDFELVNLIYKALVNDWSFVKGMQYVLKIFCNAYADADKHIFNNTIVSNWTRNFNILN